MKKVHPIFIPILLVVIFWAAQPRAFSNPPPPYATPTEKLSISSKLQLSTSLTYESPGSGWPELDLNVKNNSTRMLGFCYQGPHQEQYTIAYLPEGGNSALAKGWTNVPPRQPNDEGPPNPNGNLSTFMNISYNVAPGDTLPREVRPSDFEMVTPGYYRITATLYLLFAAVYDMPGYTGMLKLGMIKLSAPPIIVLRTKTAFVLWTAPKAARG